MKLALSRLLNKKHAILSATIIGLFLPMSVFAVSEITQLLGELIFKIIMSPFYLFLQIEMWLLVILAQYNNFINEIGVVTGWKALRDLANMFFILMLLIISFATIIRAQGYGYKQTLSRLIIVAILINFSRMIVGILIDFSQIIMLTFVQAFKEVVAGNIIVALGLAKVTAAGDNPMSDTTFIQALILGAFMLVLAVVVIGVFIAILAARIVKLWILIIMSPMAFLAYIFPRTQGFFNKWVSDLGRNLFSGPTLAFFLWLTFIITGGGTIHNSFFNRPSDSSAISEVSAAASADNVINYVIALALLAGSLQIVAASGAAGASVAGRAAKGVNNYAAKLGRRYPLAIASRTGALASRGIINKDGEARKLLGVWNWSKTPFIGGRVQRTAMKMQGYDAARIRREHEEDTKYIKPTQMSQFYKGQETKQRLLGSSKLGKLYSTISSQGGNFDKDALSAQTKVKRGEVDVNNANWVAGNLRRIGDEESLQKVQGEFHSTFADKGEAMRLIRSKDLKGILGSFNGDSYYVKDKNGKIMRDESGRALVQEGAKYAMQAIHDPSHGQADANAISKLLLSNNKTDRWAFDSVKREYFSELFGEDIRRMATVSTDDGKMDIGKRQEVGVDLDNPAMIAYLSLAKDYPNKTIDKVDPKTGHLVELGPDMLIVGKMFQEMQRAAFTPGQVASRVQRMQDETRAEFKTRKQEIADLDSSVWTEDQSKLVPHLQGRFKTEEDFEAYRDDRYHQLTGLRPMFEDKKGKKLVRPKYWDDADIFESKMTDEEKIRAYYYRHTAPRSLRKDIVKQTDLAKESDEGQKAREEFSNRGQSAKAFVDEVEAKVKRALPIYQSNWEGLAPGFDPETLEYLRRKIVAEVGGSKRFMHDLPSHSAWTEITDGAHGSRGAEVNVGNWQEAAKLDHFIEPMENQQQAQMFAVSVPDQTEHLLKTLVDLGKKPQKTIVENVGEFLRAEAMQSYGDSVGLDSNHLPQDYNRLTSDFGKMLYVMSTQAKSMGMTLSKFLQLEKNEGAFEWLKKNIDLYNVAPDVAVEDRIDINNIDNDKNIKKMIDAIRDLDIDVQPHKIPESGESGQRPNKEQRRGA